MTIPDYAKISLRRSSLSVVDIAGGSHLLLVHCLVSCSDDPWIHESANINDALTQTFSIDPVTFSTVTGYTDIDLDSEQQTIFDKLADFGIAAIEVLSKSKRYDDQFISLGQYSPEELKTMDLYNHYFKFQIVENS